jgi:hypothetical protein
MIQIVNCRRFSFVVVPLFLGVCGALSSLIGARAGETHEFVIASNDGYGVQDCLAEASECGQVVADAWCEAHGRGPAVSFGPRSAFSSAVATRVAAAEEAYIVKCQD